MNTAEMIHNEFNTQSTGDRTISARGLEALKKAGFRTNIAIDESLGSRYPLYKTIKKHNVERICEKYNLVLSTTNRYLGDIPSKNIQEMAEFLTLTKDKVSVDKYKRLNWGWVILAAIIGWTVFNIINWKHIPDWMWGIYAIVSLVGLLGGMASCFLDGHWIVFRKYKSLVDDNGAWFICAPKWDLDMTRAKVEGVEVVADDPIVLFAPMKENGDREWDMFFIITAWGPEAKDVVNEDHN